MTRLKKLRLLIFVIGFIWITGTPIFSNLFERSLLLEILTFGGWVFLAVSCIVYMYGFFYWKDV
jgi:hypothetical protein